MKRTVLLGLWHVVGFALQTWTRAAGQSDIAPIPGQLDPAFAPEILRDGIVAHIQKAGAGKFIVVGDFTRVNGDKRNQIARIHSDGSTDSDFNAGEGADQQIDSVIVQPDGKVLIAGSFSRVGGLPRLGLARLEPDGRVDRSFDPGVGSRPVLALQPDGKIVCADWGGVTRLFPNGSPDWEFGVSTLLLVNRGTTGLYRKPKPPLGPAPIDLALGVDGNILVNESQENPWGRRIVRLTSQGDIEPSFASDTHGPVEYGFHPLSTPDGSRILSLPDGSSVMVGYFDDSNEPNLPRLRKLTPTGRVDSSFQAIANDYISSVRVTHDGKLLIGGSFTQVNGLPRNRIARLLSSGSLDPTFQLRSGPNRDVHSVCLLGSGQVLLGGEFDEVDGVYSPGLALVSETGEVDTRFHAETSRAAAVHAVVALPDGKLLVGGRFDQVNNERRHNLVRLDAEGRTDPAFEFSLTNGVAKLAIEADGKIVAALFNSLGYDFPGTLFRLNADGSVLARLSLPHTGYYISALQEDLDGGVWASGFVPGASEGAFLDRLWTGTPRRVPWFSSWDGEFWALVFQTDGKLIVSRDPTPAGSSSGPGLVRVDPAGQLDLTFQTKPELAGEVIALAVGADGKIMVGQRAEPLSTVTIPAIVRLNLDGSQDEAFTIGDGPNGAVHDLAITHDQKILVAGSFTTFNTSPRQGLARLFGGHGAVKVAGDVPQLHPKDAHARSQGNSSSVRSRTVGESALASLTRGVSPSLAEALDVSNLVWETGGDALWVADTVVAHDDFSSAQSGRIGARQSSWLETEVRGPGQLSFWWRFDSKEEYPHASFSFGIGSTTLPASKEWKQATFSIPLGVHRLRWDLNDWNSSGDQLWVDEVTYVPVPALTVTSTNDSGPGSLRQAILDANTQRGSQRISFAIPGPGPHTIRPNSALPSVTDALFIDGYSQPGTQPNIDPVAQKAVLSIEIDGSSAGSEVHGLVVAASECIVSGLVINRFSGAGIVLDASQCRVEGNFIGTDPTGRTGLGNQGSGIWVRSGGRIGGTQPAERNLISGNGGNGIFLGRANGAILGNLIGTDASQTSPIGNRCAGIGVAAAIGMWIENNVIAGNGDAGIWVLGPLSTNNWIELNLVGTDSSRTRKWGNGPNAPGLRLEASDVMVGLSNVFAFHAAAGVRVLSGIRNEMRRNLFTGNQKLGIDLGLDGPDVNDPGDLDTGANELQNYPILTSASVEHSTVIEGQIIGQPSRLLTIDLYAASQVNAAGYGQGERLLASVKTTSGADGTASFRLAAEPISVGEFVVATATDDGSASAAFGLAEFRVQGLPGRGPGGNTSEFSQGIQVTPGVPGMDGPPELAIFSDQTWARGECITLNFLVSDAETPPDALTVSARSSDEQQFPAAKLSLSGPSVDESRTGARWTLSACPMVAKTGQVTINLQVADSAGQTATSSVTVTYVDAISLTLAPDAVSSSVGASTLVPVRAFGFKGLSALSLSILWDPTVARFRSLEPGALGSDLAVDLAQADRGIAQANWLHHSSRELSLPDGTSLFGLRFDVIGPVGASSSVLVDGVWAHSPLLGLSSPSVTSRAGAIVVVSEPALITPVSLNAVHDLNAGLQIAFSSSRGNLYVLEATPVVPAEQWTEVARITGDGTDKSYSISPGTAQSFYRLRVQAESTAAP